MKLEVNFGFFGGELLVTPSGKATISRKDRDFSIHLKQFRDERIESIDVCAVNGLTIVIAHDGWQFSIEEHISDTKMMVVKRRRELKGKLEIQYLNKHGKWLSRKGLGKYPSDVLTIPIFTSEKVVG